MSDRATALRRRRRARAAGAATALAIVAALGVIAGQPRPRAEPAPAASEDVRLPSGCETEDRRPPRRPRLPGRPPDLDSVPKGALRAVIRTSCGVLEVALYPRRAPRNVANFVGLARRGFYDGLPWHRIENDFVVQSGDPNGRGDEPPDGPPYRVPDELAGTRSRDYVFGVVAMANRGRNTAGSQFFIVVHDYAGATGQVQNPRPVEPAGLRPDYTIIGRVERASWDNLNRLAAVRTRGGLDLAEAAEPILPVYVDSIAIESSG